MGEHFSMDNGWMNGTMVGTLLIVIILSCSAGMPKGSQEI